MGSKRMVVAMMKPGEGVHWFLNLEAQSPLAHETGSLTNEILAEMFETEIHSSVHDHGGKTQELSR